MNVIVEDLKKIDIEEYMDWFYGLYAKYTRVKKLYIYLVKDEEIYECTSSDGVLCYSTYRKDSFVGKVNFATPLVSEMEYVMQYTNYQIDTLYQIFDIEEMEDITAYENPTKSKEIG